MSIVEPMKKAKAQQSDISFRGFQSVKQTLSAQDIPITSDSPLGICEFWCICIHLNISITGCSKFRKFNSLNLPHLWTCASDEKPRPSKRKALAKRLGSNLAKISSHVVYLSMFPLFPSFPSSDLSAKHRKTSKRRRNSLNAPRCPWRWCWERLLTQSFDVPMQEKATRCQCPSLARLLDFGSSSNNGVVPKNKVKANWSLVT